MTPISARPAASDDEPHRKTFNGDVVALKDMNLTVNEGDFLSLLGPSAVRKVDGTSPDREPYSANARARSYGKAGKILMIWASFFRNPR